MTGTKGQKLGLALSLAVFLVLAAWLMPGRPALHLTLVEENRTFLVLPMAAGERFTLHYYHSVENAPIWEEHTLDRNGKIYIEEERYEKFGAGMGKMPGVGRMVTKGNYEAIVDMHMPVGDFILRVGSPRVDHTLIWRDKQFHLSALFPHKAVQFSGRRVSPLRYLLHYVKQSLGADPAPGLLKFTPYTEEPNDKGLTKQPKEQRG